MTWSKVFSLGDKFLEVFLLGGRGWDVWGDVNSVNGGAGCGFGCGMIVWKFS